jgi:hypothetical protein
MKKLIYFLSLIVLVTACNPQEKKAAENLMKGPAHFALSLDSAIIYTKHYRKVSREIFKDTVPVKAFTVRAADLIESLGIAGVDSIKYSHVRVYLGLDNNNKFRLFLTPVKDASIKDHKPGEDVILNGPYMPGLDEVGNVSSSGSYVLDFTAPCPTSCPTGSPLN